jgi:N-methylhydantoinase A/oxoprolinase/acetone carboxylase beta subunit
MKAIGVDVGGSFADSVLCDMNTGQVPISAKIMS